jgi:hypothetical protein
VIDYSNEIFNDAASTLRNAVSGITVIGEYVSSPTSFPTVTIDEIDNRQLHRDSAKAERFAAVRYRVQVFSNKSGGKRAEARSIFNVIDTRLAELGFTRKTYTATPDVYNSSVYQITATFDAVIGADGVIYKN